MHAVHRIRLFLETDFASVSVKHIREARVLCMVAESAFFVWLRSIYQSNFSKYLVHLNHYLCNTGKIPYGGLNSSMPLKQTIKDPEYAALGLHPTDLVLRESEMRKKRRADWTYEERWQKPSRAHESIENQTDIQREKIADNKKLRAAEKKAMSAVEKLVKLLGIQMLVKLPTSLERARTKSIQRSGEMSWPNWKHRQSIVTHKGQPEMTGVAA